MSYTFLSTEIETIVLFISVGIYLTIISLIQGKFIKKLKSVNKKSSKEKIAETKASIKKLRLVSLLYCLIGLIFHVILYLAIESPYRSGYFLSMFFVYLGSCVIVQGNFLLRGESIFRGTGDFGGLPG